MKNILLILTLFSCGISFSMDTPKDALFFFSQAPKEIFTMVVPTIDDEYTTSDEMTPLLIAVKYAPAIKFAQTCQKANFTVAKHYSCLGLCRKYFLNNNTQLTSYSMLPASLFIRVKEEKENNHRALIAD